MISRYKPDAEFALPERCFINELHNRDDDDGCSIARARVAPGVTTELHSLTGVAERYVVLEGEGLVEVGGGTPERVGPLDVVVIVPAVTQRITNTGTTDLIFLCICTPRFRPEIYVAASGAAG
jgi:mannose-6-phosphate isomerase-like protein (cupin superfamily)